MISTLFMVLLKVAILAVGLFFTAKAWKDAKLLRAIGIALATFVILLVL